MSSVMTQAHVHKDSIEAVLQRAPIPVRQVRYHVQAFRIVHIFSHFVTCEVRKAFQGQDENITTCVQAECAEGRHLLEAGSTIIGVVPVQLFQDHQLLQGFPHIPGGLDLQHDAQVRVPCVCSTLAQDLQ